MPVNGKVGRCSGRSRRAAIGVLGERRGEDKGKALSFHTSPGSIRAESRYQGAAETGDGRHGKRPTPPAHLEKKKKSVIRTDRRRGEEKDLGVEGRRAKEEGP